MHSFLTIEDSVSIVRYKEIVATAAPCIPVSPASGFLSQSQVACTWKCLWLCALHCTFLWALQSGKYSSDFQPGQGGSVYVERVIINQSSRYLSTVLQLVFLRYGVSCLGSPRNLHGPAVCKLRQIAQVSLQIGSVAIGCGCSSHSNQHCKEDAPPNHGTGTVWYGGKGTSVVYQR